MKIVNFAGGPPSDGSNLHAPVLVEELQVLIMVVMVMMMLKTIKMVFTIKSLGFEVWEACAWSSVEF